MHSDQVKLQKAGYLTKRLTQYHFQVKKQGDKKVINVWPTARKILTQYHPGPADKYTDIVQAVKDCYALPDQGRQIFIVPMYDMDTPQWQEIFRYRKDPFKYLKERRYEKI